MKLINKAPLIPNGFIQACTEHGVLKKQYNDLKYHTKLKEFLVKEQHELCCYCQSAIEYAKASIEHFIPQKLSPNLDLVYYNLFAVCDGNQKKGHITHCDKAKLDCIVGPIIYFKDCFTRFESGRYNHTYISVNKGTGLIAPNRNLKVRDCLMVQDFINATRLNHEKLKNARLATLGKILKRINAGLTTKTIEIERHIHPNSSLPHNQFIVLSLASI